DPPTPSLHTRRSSDLGADFDALAGDVSRRCSHSADDIALAPIHDILATIIVLDQVGRHVHRARACPAGAGPCSCLGPTDAAAERSEEHTSELQSRENL